MNLYAVQWGKIDCLGDRSGKWHASDEDDESQDYAYKTLCGLNIPICDREGNLPATSEALAPVSCAKCLKALDGLQLKLTDTG